jgi:co-chaperonin GroES (HSP10)
MEIKPLGNNLLLKPIKGLTESQAGFVMVQNKENEVQIGEVVGVGGDVQKIKKGNLVAYANFSGAEISGLLLITETDILGIIKQNGKQKNSNRSTKKG